MPSPRLVFHGDRVENLKCAAGFTRRVITPVRFLSTVILSCPPAKIGPGVALGLCSGFLDGTNSRFGIRIVWATVSRFVMENLTSCSGRVHARRRPTVI